MRVFFDMDGTLAKWGTISSEKDLYKQGYFLNRVPEEWLISELRLLHLCGVEEFIVTNYLKNSSYAYEEKVEWIKRHIPEIRKEHCIYVPYGENKAQYVMKSENIQLQYDDILIDDHSPVLFAWERAGGTAIKHMNGINGTNGTWKGRKVGKGCELPNSLFFMVNAIQQKYCPKTKFKEYFPFVASSRDSDALFHHLNFDQLTKINRDILIYETGNIAESDAIKHHLSILWYESLISTPSFLEEMKSQELLKLKEG